MDKRPYRVWGDSIDIEAHQQMETACRLPVTVEAALMPDAHVGYGIPIGGVLATENVVIPYAVGVDIACRVMLTVLDVPLERFNSRTEKFRNALEEQTQFGIGAKWKERKLHPVLDENWSVTKLTASLKDGAWSQLGTSGSGNHFVEFGKLEVIEAMPSLKRGEYLALVSHSGSRGSGAKVASYYSELAKKLHPELPKEMSRLAWLSMDSEGQEYWAAMELMGKYASANHHIIHQEILAAIGASPLMQVENHHNFAWKEKFEGKELIVHRKGATPAGKGVLGYVPGSMTAPGYLVEGLGKREALNSCSHGAGRQMSRTKARAAFTRKILEQELAKANVELLSAGLDEAPGAYKDMEMVMSAQADLVKRLGKFSPLLVKMAREGERAED